MLLIVQIPCYNEADTLPEVLADIPRELPGVDRVEVLVIDDGSTDGTVEVARQHGADHVVRLPRNRGLAHAFAAGVEAALGLGADIIVNTDGDHQYQGHYILDLIEPIVSRQADMVVGDRQVHTIPHFSRIKKLLQRIGSWVVRWTSDTDVADATSGFRALSSEAAMRLTIFSRYTYTLETIIQAGKKGLVVASVPVGTNEKKRESRLIRSTPRYLLRSAVTIVRIFLMYEPLKVFSWLSLMPLLASAGLFARYLYFYGIGEGAGHVQSFIVAAVLALVAFQVLLLGLLADLIARNRRLNEDLLYRVRGNSRSVTK